MEHVLRRLRQENQEDLKMQEAQAMQQTWLRSKI